MDLMIARMMKVGGQGQVNLPEISILLSSSIFHGMRLD